MTEKFDPTLGKVEVDIDDVHIIVGWIEDPKNGAHMFVFVGTKVWFRTDRTSGKATKKFVLRQLRGEAEFPTIQEYFGWPDEFAKNASRGLIEKINALEDPEVE